MKKFDYKGCLFIENSGPTKSNLFFFSARVTPFKLSVFTDGSEAVGSTAAVAMAKANEASAGALLTPTGTMGFSLGFAQVDC